MNGFFLSQGGQGEARGEEMAMLLWKNSDGVYNFIIIGSIVRLYRVRAFRGTAILHRQFDFISQYAST